MWWFPRGGHGYGRSTESPRQERIHDDAWDMVMWSVMSLIAKLIRASNAGRSPKSPPQLWRFLAQYPLLGARAYPNGERTARTVYYTAYLATPHRYIVTGTAVTRSTSTMRRSCNRFLRPKLYAARDG